MIMVFSLVVIAVLASLANTWSDRPLKYDDEAMRRLLTMLVATRESGWIAAAQRVADQKARGPVQWRPEFHKKPVPSPMRTGWRWE